MQPKTKVRILPLITILIGTLSMWFPTTIRAQQNLFNIPSGAITPGGKFFFQQQVNSYDLLTYGVKAHFIWGLGRGWDAGFNLLENSLYLRNDSELGVWKSNTDLSQGPLYPSLLFTGQKGWKLKAWAFNIGTQTGLNLASQSSQTHLLFNHYALVKWHPTERITAIGGGYAANFKYVGVANRIIDGIAGGVLLGMEYEVTHKLLLMADYISGTNAQSTLAAGINYYVTPKFQICLGGLVPSPGSTNKYGVVLEINLLNYREKDYH